MKNEDINVKTRDNKLIFGFKKESPGKLPGASASPKLLQEDLARGKIRGISNILNSLVPR